MRLLLDLHLSVEVDVDLWNAGADCSIAQKPGRVALLEGGRRPRLVGGEVVDAGAVVEVARIERAVERAACRRVSADDVARRSCRRPRPRRAAEALVEEAGSQHRQLDARAQVLGDLKISDDLARLLIVTEGKRSRLRIRYVEVAERAQTRRGLRQVVALQRIGL